MLILARKVHENIMIGDQIEVSIVDIKGDQVKLGIKAPANVKVFRQEVYEAIQAENRAAAMTKPDRIPPLEGILKKNKQENLKNGGKKSWKNSGLDSEKDSEQ